MVFVMRAPLFQLLAIGAFAAAIPARADTITPSSGPDVTAMVTKYANSSFEVRAADGKTQSYSSNSIKRIAFDARPMPVKVQSRTKGALEGKVSTYENGAFTVEGATGAERLPAIFVERITFTADPGREVAVIARGNEVDLTKHIALGSVTIIDFYADWCGPCKRISPMLEQLAKSDPEIVLRKIDIVNWGSPVAKQYKVQSIPRVEIYSRAGKLVGTVRGVSDEQVRTFVAQAKTGN